jgi:chromosome segregation ATPase
MFGLVSRHRHLTALDEVDRLRRERDAAEERAATAENNRRQILRQLAAADATIVRLHGRNRELGDRVEALAAADPQRAAALARRVDRLRRIVARLLAAYREQRRRADQLQARLDDALGLTDPRVENGARWQHTREDRRRTGVAS